MEYINKVIDLKRSNKDDTNNNYRGITVIPSRARVIRKIFQGRIQQTKDLNEAQNSFRPGRSYVDDILCASYIKKPKDKKFKTLDFHRLLKSI